MSGFVLSVFIILLAFVFVMRIANRIPKTGRYNSAAGEKIEAVLTNENRTAEKAATMKLMDKDGRKYCVKLKADEARLWIKGDTVEILLSENKRIYRVLFNDYFRNNEERIRQHAVQRLQKAAFARALVQIAACGADHADVHRQHHAPVHANQTAVLEHV